METRDIVQPARIIEQPAMRLAGIRRRFTYAQMPEIPALWGEFDQHIGSVNDATSPICYGVITEALGEDVFDYAAATDLTSGRAVPPELTEILLPPHRYAVFPHEGTLPTLCQTIDAAMSWAKENGHLPPKEAVILERYGETFDPVAGQGDLEIWLSLGN